MWQILFKNRQARAAAAAYPLAHPTEVKKQLSHSQFPQPFRRIPGTARGESMLVLRTYGIKINIDDMEKALAFYCGKLGFVVRSERLLSARSGQEGSARKFPFS